MAFFCFLWTRSGQNYTLNFMNATRKCENRQTSENALFVMPKNVLELFSRISVIWGVIYQDISCLVSQLLWFVPTPVLFSFQIRIDPAQEEEAAIGGRNELETAKTTNVPVSQTWFPVFWSYIIAEYLSINNQGKEGKSTWVIVQVLFGT